MNSFVQGIMCWRLRTDSDIGFCYKNKDILNLSSLSFYNVSLYNTCQVMTLSPFSPFQLKILTIQPRYKGENKGRKCFFLCDRGGYNSTSAPDSLYNSDQVPASLWVCFSTWNGRGLDLMSFQASFSPNILHGSFIMFWRSSPIQIGPRHS